jgi:hypothetical protein
VGYILIVAFVVLVFVILFGAGVFKSVDSSPGEDADKETYSHQGLSDNCLWHINAYIESLDTKPTAPAEIGAAVYEALSEWLSQQYEEEA